MKITVVGDFSYEIYEKALCEGLESQNILVDKCIIKSARFYNIKICYKNTVQLYRHILREKPNVLFIYRVDLVFPWIFQYFKRKYPQLKILIYHNDDPFRPTLKRRLKHFNYLHYVKYADIVYVYRTVNIDEAYRRGAKKVKLYMSHYYSKNDFRELKHSDFFNKDGRIIFIGHYENDERLDYINYLFHNNVNLHIYGPENWLVVFKKNNWPVSHYHEVIRGDEYRRTIHKASIALAFFSAANRDEYTRRCFEIPIAGTVIAAKRTKMTELIFQNNENSILFSTKEELLQSIRNVLDTSKLSFLGENGYKLIKNGEYSEIDRAKMVIKDIKELNL